MALKKHHKIVIGSFSTLIIIALVANSIFIYFLYAQFQISYNSLEEQINNLQTDTQIKMNELTDNLLMAQEELTSLGSQIGSIDKEVSSIKASTSSDFSGIIEDAIKSVVTVRTDVSQGTGFIITDDGYIVTNAHVLSGASEVNIITFDQGNFEADFIGFDSEMDLALLKIPGDYNSIELADSDDIQIGEKVIAIGNPLGLQFSVSEGIVSGIHRVGSNGLEAYVQTDAALNSGNSGGPLIDKEGEVIGINNFKIKSGENLGFALESNYIEETVKDIAQEVLGESLI